MKDIMKKNDFILIALLFTLSIVAIFLLRFTREEGAYLVVFVDGGEYRSFDLTENISFTIDLEDGNSNSFEIKDGYVKMVRATCPDKTCVKTKAIHYDKETITCLPNRVLLQVISAETSDLDAVAN